MKKNILLTLKNIAIIYLWFLFVPVTFIIKLLKFVCNQIKNIFYYIDRRYNK